MSVAARRRLHSHSPASHSRCPRTSNQCTVGARGKPTRPIHTGAATGRAHSSALKHPRSAEIRQSTSHLRSTSRPSVASRLHCHHPTPLLHCARHSASSTAVHAQAAAFVPDYLTTSPALSLLDVTRPAPTHVVITVLDGSPDTLVLVIPRGGRRLRRRARGLHMADSTSPSARFLHDAVREGRLTSATVFASVGVVDTPDEGGWSPLMMAAVRGNAPMVHVLLDAGAYVHWTGPGAGDDVAALHLAAIAGDPDCIQDLLLFGANVNSATPVERVTPLMAAAGGGGRIVPAVSVLLKTDATVNATSATGDTPLHIVARAVATDAAQAAAMLLDTGKAELSMVNKRGDAPLDVARRAACAAVPAGVSATPLPPLLPPGAARGVVVTALIDTIALVARRRRMYGGM